MRTQNEPYFIFKGINSKKMRLQISTLPQIVKPKRRITNITIAGRNGNEIEDSGTYEGYTLSIGCGIEHITQTELEKMWEWLDGSGDLILSTEPTRVYKARVDNDISLSDMYWVFQNFLVQFDVEPFKYSVNKSNDFVTLIKSGTLHNKGSYYAEPILKVYGNGTVTMQINGKIYSCQNVTDYVTIDSTLQMVYKNNINKNADYLTRDFPKFKKGENTITFLSGVTKIEIEPNWRWL